MGLPIFRGSLRAISMPLDPVLSHLTLSDLFKHILKDFKTNSVLKHQSESSCISNQRGFIVDGFFLADLDLISISMVL